MVFYYILIYLFLVIKISYQQSDNYQPTCSNIPGQFWNLSQCLYCSNKKCYCTDIDTCTRCIEGYYLDINTQDCKKCPIGCSECCNRKSISQLICTQCETDYKLLSGVCILQNNCTDLGEHGYCLQCNKGHYLSNNGECLKCDQSCDNCISITHCLQCKQGFYQPQVFESSLDLNCLQCQDVNSKICTGNQGQIIQSCRIGYFLENLSENNQCQQCFDLCQQCTEYESCIQGQCVSKAFQYNGCTFRCRADKNQFCGGSWYNNIFEIKNDGSIVDLGCWRDGRDEKQLRSLDCKFRNKESFLPLECAEACKNNNSEGTKCDIYEGDYDNDGQDDPVIDPPSYKYAGIQFFGECLCGNRVDVFKFGSGSGKQCESCKSVNSRFGITQGQCDLCELRTLRLDLDADLCNQIDCEDVRELRPECSMCQDGYYLTDFGECLECPFGAIKCISQYKIVQCKEGDILVRDLEENSVCVKNYDVYNCSNIQIVHHYTDLIEYNQRDQNLSCMDCLPYVFNRDPQTGEQIFDDIVFFFKNDDKICQKCEIQNCVKCNHETNNINNIVCNQCKNQYTISLDQKQCLKCQENCIECKQQNENVNCTKCIEGYIVDKDKNCSICSVQNCKDCVGSQCNLCMPGYGLNDVNGNSCQKCQIGCEICDLNTSLCTKCLDGYFWKQFVCYPNTDKCLKTSNNGYCILCSSENYEITDESQQFNSQIYSSYKGKCIDCSNYESGSYKCKDYCLDFRTYTVQSNIIRYNYIIFIFFIIILN